MGQSCALLTNRAAYVGFVVPQAYTSQFIALVMVALYLGDDRISTLARRRLIIDDLKTLPGAYWSAFL